MDPFSVINFLKNFGIELLDTVIAIGNSADKNNIHQDSYKNKQ